MDRQGGKIIVIASILLTSLVAFSAGFVVRDLRYDIPDADKAFLQVLDELMENHYSQPTREELLTGAIDGMILSLNDPFSSYFDLEEAESFSQNLGESYVGIGVSVNYINNNIVIEKVEQDGPAFNAGIHVNDIITHVDGESIENISFYEAIGMIKGEVDTEVSIGVYRAGFPDTLFFSMTRAEIDNSSIFYTSYTEDDKLIGYIGVNAFGEETAQLFSNAIAVLESNEIDGLIVDVRNNGGGYLSTVYNMMNMFLINDGNPMFSTEYYQNGVNHISNYSATNTERKPYEIVTLVNGNSASASEVFSSGMQEHGNYVLVGTTTYGKGTMQTGVGITSTVGDVLHITIGKWITADGNWVHYDGGTDGITPDIVVEQNSFETAYKVFLMNDEVIEYDTVDTRTSNVQVILNMLGYSVRTDGYFDAETLAAVEDIQSVNALTVSGDLNAETLEVLNQELAEYQSNVLNDTQLQAAINVIMDGLND